MINEYGPTETVVGCCVYRVPGDRADLGSHPDRAADRQHAPVRPGWGSRAGARRRRGRAVHRRRRGGAGIPRRPGLDGRAVHPRPIRPGSRADASTARGTSPAGGPTATSNTSAGWIARSRSADSGSSRARSRRRSHAIPSVREAAVVAREHGPDDRRLVAYVTLAAGRTAPDDAELRRFLRSSLPEPMIPSAFVVLESPPADAQWQGRSRGPAGSRSRPGAARSPHSWPPRAGRGSGGVRLERWSCGWSGSAPTTTSSTSAATRCWRRRSSRGSAKRPASRFRSAPSSSRPRSPDWPSGSRRCGAVTHGARLHRSNPPRRVGPLPLSFSQEALWFLDQLAPGQPTFNVTAAVRIAGPLDLGALGGASTSSSAGTSRSARHSSPAAARRTR